MHSQRHPITPLLKEAVDAQPVQRSTGSDPTSPSHQQEALAAMDTTRGHEASFTSSSTYFPSPSEDTGSPRNSPFVQRHGRRYLADTTYPLPCDLPELQRQNLHTLLGITVFGRVSCAPRLRHHAPRKVLELGCGSGYWSSACHDYFTSQGHPNVSFTGLDIAPLAPDFRKQGINWRFVQHDLRRLPFPFDDEEFDLVVLKDLSLVLPLGASTQPFLDENIRILKVGGTLEIWESDHVLRSLLPHPPPPPSKRVEDETTAVLTGTFLISPSTPFAGAQNRYIQNWNAWIQEALHRRQLPPAPCARVAQVLLQEPEALGDIGYRRVAIPLGELRWEREGVGDLSSKGKGRQSDTPLTADQAALRYTALLTVVQMVESLEPLLREVSGKNTEEWQYWWACMMTDLLTQKGAASGECLELGAWWATKL